MNLAIWSCRSFRKSIVFAGLLSLLITAMAFAAEPEFDGAYIKTDKGKYHEIKEQKAYTTQLSRGGMTVSQLMHSPKYYYVIKNEGAKITGKEFVGLLIKGNLSFNNLTLNKLSPIEVGAKVGLFDNKGPASKGSMLLTAGEEVAVNKKAVGAHGYYCQPKSKLAAGSYVLWVNKAFWIINIDVKDDVVADKDFATGALAAGFTDNGDGTVTDTGTMLMWQQCSAGLSKANCGVGAAGTYTWENAITYCEGLTLGGHSDWRLPKINELKTIADRTKKRPSVNTTYFPNTVAKGYWSSTTYANNTTEAWLVSFSNGIANAARKTFNPYVRCVR